MLERAKGLGVFGTKERSVINLANAAGIAAVVAQQFEVARSRCSRHGLVPIIEPEVNIKSAERDAGRPILLLTRSSKQLDAVPDGQRVMLKLSIPAEAGPVRSRWSSIPRCCASSRCRAASRARKPAASWPGTRA